MRCFSSLRSLGYSGVGARLTARPDFSQPSTPFRLLVPRHPPHALTSLAALPGPPPPHPRQQVPNILPASTSIHSPRVRAMDDDLFWSTLLRLVSSECRQPPAPMTRPGPPELTTAARSHRRCNLCPPNCQRTTVVGRHPTCLDSPLAVLSADRCVSAQSNLVDRFRSSTRPARSFSFLAVVAAVAGHFPHLGKLLYRARSERDNPGCEENVTPWRKSHETQRFLLAIFLASPAGVPRFVGLYRRLSPSPRRGFAARSRPSGRFSRRFPRNRP